MRRRLVGVVYVLLTAIIFLGFSITTVEGLPSHALVLVSGNHYYPALDEVIATVSTQDSHAYVVRADHARSIGATPSPLFQGYFSGEEQSEFRYWLECRGWVSPKSRWRSDGTWKW